MSTASTTTTKNSTAKTRPSAKSCGENTMPTEWDASKQRIQTIAQRSGLVEDYLARFLQKRDASSFNGWISHLTVLWTSIRPHVDNVEEATTWEEIKSKQDIETALNAARNIAENPPEVWNLEPITKTHNAVAECRVAANLDIKQIKDYEENPEEFYE